MSRPRVNFPRLRELDRSAFLEFEREVQGAVAREEQARRQEKLDAQAGKKRRRRRR